MNFEVAIIIILVISFALIGEVEVALLVAVLSCVWVKFKPEPTKSIDDASRLAGDNIDTFDEGEKPEPKPKPEPEELGPYMGAIDLDEYDLVDDMPGAQRDRRTTDNSNPFDLNRYYSYAPKPCDEIAIHANNLDASEKTVLQVRSRNSATRQQAGTFDRLSQLRYAFEEEVEEEGEKVWWGRHET